MYYSRLARTLAFSVLGLFALTACSADQAPARKADAFTPVVVSLMGPRPAAVLGTDDRYHLVYELRLTNTKRAPATISKVEVLDADHPSRVLASYTGRELLGGLRTLQPMPVTSPVIPLGESRLFYIELTFEAGHVPRAITHHFWLLGAKDPGPATPPTPLDYRAATVLLDPSPLPIFRPPLAGDNWVAVNGCCNSLIIHRGSFQSINGRLYDAQRFAIDYMRLNDQGEFVHGDPGKLGSYLSYGSKVYAVASGTVVEMLETLDDQPPGQLPDPTTLTVETVDGNHVILDIGNGRYAFYAHLQKGSVTVQVGEHVERGQVIGLLGNSGNTSAPHLHFHIMNKPSALGSSGLPYVLDQFDLVGQVDIEKWESSPGITGHWGKRFANPRPQDHRFPLNLNIVDFPDIPGQ
ncbi:MAG: M23 family metallopeptidase [Gammaproteobacteria bacterium]|nr:M23 family metallopeptidase [Gammaproteobacteria bacterium]